MKNSLALAKWNVPVVARSVPRELQGRRRVGRVPVVHEERRNVAAEASVGGGGGKVLVRADPEVRRRERRDKLRRSSVGHHVGSWWIQQCSTGHSSRVPGAGDFSLTHWRHLYGTGSSSVVRGVLFARPAGEYGFTESGGKFIHRRDGSGEGHLQDFVDTVE